MQVTFKDLKKRATLEATTQAAKALERLRDKPFWIWDSEQHKQEDVRTEGIIFFKSTTTR
jgi:hypothetical protein